MTSLAEIFETAMTATSNAIDDAVKTATLRYEERGAYNATTQQYQSRWVEITDVQAMVDQRAAAQRIFPNYEFGQEDVLIWVGNFSYDSAPEIGWEIEFDSKKRRVMAVGDIMEAGDMFALVCN